MKIYTEHDVKTIRAVLTELITELDDGIAVGLEEEFERYGVGFIRRLTFISGKYYRNPGVYPRPSWSEKEKP